MGNQTLFNALFSVYTGGLAQGIRQTIMSKTFSLTKYFQRSFLTPLPCYSVTYPVTLLPCYSVT